MAALWTATGQNGSLSKSRIGSNPSAILEKSKSKPVRMMNEIGSIGCR